MDFELYRNYPPGDPTLVDKIVCQLKSQGIFDQFRKECISDVDTKPAYQNLRQRVDGSVAGFLANQEWKPDLNKNQLRESLRKHVQSGGFLEVGVERIVDQVVNPKICQVFLPQVKEVVYECLGIKKPKPKELSAGTSVALTASNLPPKREASVNLEKSNDNIVTSTKPQVPVDSLNVKEFKNLSKGCRNEKNILAPLNIIEDVLSDNSFDSHVSGITELASHSSLSLNVSKESNASEDKYVMENSEVLNECTISKTEDSTTDSLIERPVTPVLHQSDTNISGFDSDSLIELGDHIKSEDVCKSENDKKCNVHSDIIISDHELTTTLEFKDYVKEDHSCSISENSKNDSDDYYSMLNEGYNDSEQIDKETTIKNDIWKLKNREKELKESELKMENRKDEVREKHSLDYKRLEQSVSSFDSIEMSPVKDDSLENETSESRQFSDKSSDRNAIEKIVSDEDEKERKENRKHCRSNDKSKSRDKDVKKDHHSKGHRESHHHHHHHHHHHSRENSRDSKDSNYSSNDKKCDKNKPHEKIKDDNKNSCRSQEEIDKQKEDNKEKERKKSESSDSKHKDSSRSRHHSESKPDLKSKSRSDSDSRERHLHHHVHSKEEKRDKLKQRDESKDCRKDSGRERIKDEISHNRDGQNIDNSDKRRYDGHRAKNKEEKSDHHKESKHDTYSKDKERNKSLQDNSKSDKFYVESRKEEKRTSIKSYIHEKDKRHDSDLNKRHSEEKSEDRYEEKQHKKHESSKSKKRRDHCKSGIRYKEDRRSADRDSNGSGDRGSAASGGIRSVESRHGEKKLKESIGSKNVSDNSASDSVDRLMDKTLSDVENKEPVKSNNAESVFEIQNVVVPVDMEEIEKNNIEVPKASVLTVKNSVIAKIRKPKIAANIFEVRKIMLARKNIEKMERNRLRMCGNNYSACNGFYYFKQSEIQTARDRLNNFKECLERFEDGSLFKNVIEKGIRFSEVITNERKVITLNDVHRYKILAQDAVGKNKVMSSDYTKTCKKMEFGLNGKEYRNIEKEVLLNMSNEHLETQPSLKEHQDSDISNLKRSPVKLRISVRNPNDCKVIDMQEILMYNQDVKCYVESPKSSAETQTLALPLGESSAVPSLKENFVQAAENENNEVDANICFRESAIYNCCIVDNTNALSNASVELKRKRGRPRKKSELSMKNAHCFPKKTSSDKQVVLSNKNNNNNSNNFNSTKCSSDFSYRNGKVIDSGNGGSPSVKESCDMKQLKTSLQNVSMSQYNISQVVSPKSSSNVASGSCSYTQLCLDDAAAVPNDGDVTQCCILGRSDEKDGYKTVNNKSCNLNQKEKAPEQISPDSPVVDKFQQYVGEKNADIISPHRYNLSDMSDYADADEGPLSEGESYLTNPLIGEALKDLIQESGLIGAFNSLPAKNSRVTGLNIEKQQKELPQRVKSQQENSRSASTRTSGRLAMNSKQAQRYESSDLYKPRFVFRQNSRRKRATLV
ncbi:uncharacterized protein LOC142330030 isoform X2 [Lycorma delicatula]|uniref:uncharacterized protein LOC142330030 isoform X2 n=1 Tax=Lycorma delicatula TaxID=130591 RepID=UPI003F512978